MKILTEMNQDVETKIFINEKTNEKNYIVSGLFLLGEAKNKNGRIYSRYILERETNKYQEKINTKSSFCELNHRNDLNINLERAASIVTKLWMDNNNIFGEMQILNNNIGKGVIIPILEIGSSLGVSSRGIGTTKQNLDNDALIVNEDYQLLNFDIVSNPSSYGAFLSLVENKEYVIENGILKECQIEELNEKLDNYKKIDPNIQKAVVQIFKEYIEKIKENM